MKAVIIREPGGPEVLEIQTVDDPVPGPDEVLVDVKATALNRADLLQRMGRYPAPAGVRSDIPGLEMAGVVAEMGNRVDSFSSGDHVCALLPGGGYAEKVVVHKDMLIPVSNTIPFEEAGSVPEAFMTAFDALFNWGHLRMGQRVLIHAVGSGVGIAAVQLAKAAGAFVIGTAGTSEKIRKAEALGLDLGINYKEQDFAEEVEKATEAEGVHVVIDFVGAPYWQKNLHSLGRMGRMVIVGTMGGRRTEVDLGELMAKRLSVSGTVLRSRTLAEKIALAEQFQRQVLPLFGRGKVKPVIDRVFRLEEVVEAHRYMESDANFGKIVLKV